MSDGQTVGYYYYYHYCGSGHYPTIILKAFLLLNLFTQQVLTRDVYGEILLDVGP